MPKLHFGERVGALVRRIFFWLPSDSVMNEQLPDILHDHALVLAVVSPERVPRWKQIRYAMRVFSLSERRILVLCGTVAFIALSVSGLWYFHEGTSVVPTVGGTFSEALSGQPKYLNPIDAVANDVDRDLVRMIYSGLFRFDGNDAVPDLAESYTWSDDRKSLTVKVRADARFHDGVAVTAEDVRFTFSSLQDPSRKSPMLPAYRNIRIDSDSDHTVTFHLERPDVNLLGKLTLGILPSHVWADVSVANSRLSDLNVKPIGSGPYRIKSFTRETNGLIHSYTLERFEQYYGIKPYLNTLTFQFFSDRDGALEAFKTDQVDALSFVNSGDAEKLAASARKRRIRLEIPEETVAFFNTKHPLLSNKDVRRALLLAIDRE